MHALRNQEDLGLESAAKVTLPDVDTLRRHVRLLDSVIGIGAVPEQALTAQLRRQ